MAWVVKCYRCGEYFDKESNKMSGSAFLTYKYVKGRYNIDSEEHDLCPKCVKDLKHFYDWLDRKEKS